MFYLTYTYIYTSLTLIFNLKMYYFIVFYVLKIGTYNVILLHYIFSCIFNYNVIRANLEKICY